MKFSPVESDMILGVGYNDKTEEMEVVFRTGERYRYKNVPRFEYEGLMAAASHGQYMRKRILGKFEYEKVS